MFPTLDWLLIAMFAIPVAVRGPRLAGSGGLLTGFGGVGLGLLGQAISRCDSFDARPGQECIMPNLAPWLALAKIVLMLGAELTVLALVMERRR